MVMIDFCLIIIQRRRSNTLSNYDWIPFWAVNGCRESHHHLSQTGGHHLSLCQLLLLLYFTLYQHTQIVRGFYCCGVPPFHSHILMMPPPVENSLCIIPTMLSRNASCPVEFVLKNTTPVRSGWNLNSYLSISVPLDR